MSGWVNLSKGKEGYTTHSVYIILRKGDGKLGEMCVRRGSVSYFCTAPTPGTYAEAVIQQRPDIEKLGKDFCRKLAECGISAKTSPDILQFFESTLQDAVEQQLMKGNKANWKRIDYPAVGGGAAGGSQVGGAFLGPSPQAPKSANLVHPKEM